MAETPLPEMMRLSLSDLALRIKIMRVDLGASIEEILSRALDPPSAINIQRAVSTLVEVSSYMHQLVPIMIRSQTHALTPAEKLTPMGRLLSKMPTDVHLGKFLLMATIFRCLDPALTIAASLNTKGPFARPFGLEQEADRARLVFKSGMSHPYVVPTLFPDEDAPTDNSDFLTIHNAFSSWKQSVIKHKAPKQYCQAHFLSYQVLIPSRCHEPDLLLLFHLCRICNKSKSCANSSSGKYTSIISIQVPIFIAFRIAISSTPVLFARILHSPMS